MQSGSHHCRRSAVDGEGASNVYRLTLRATTRSSHALSRPPLPQIGEPRKAEPKNFGEFTGFSSDNSAQKAKERVGGDCATGANGAQLSSIIERAGIAPSPILSVPFGLYDLLSRPIEPGEIDKVQAELSLERTAEMSSITLNIMRAYAKLQLERETLREQFVVVGTSLPRADPSWRAPPAHIEDYKHVLESLTVLL